MRNCVLYALEGKKNVAITWIFGIRLIYASTCVFFLIFARTLCHFRVHKRTLYNYKHLVFELKGASLTRFLYIIQDAFVVDNDDDAFYSRATRLKVIPYKSNISQRRNHE